MEDYKEFSSEEDDNGVSHETEFAEPQVLEERYSDNEVDHDYHRDGLADFMAYYSGDEHENSSDEDFGHLEYLGAGPSKPLKTPSRKRKSLPKLKQNVPWM
jgi:hypothetical protein